MIFNKSDIEFLDSVDYQKYKKAQKWLDFDFGDIWIERLTVVFFIISIIITPFIVLGPITEYSGSIIRLIILYLITGLFVGYFVACLTLLAIVIVFGIFLILLKWILRVFVFEKKFTSTTNEFEAKESQIKNHIQNYFNEIHPKIIDELVGETITSERFNELRNDIINDYSFITKARKVFGYIEGGYDFAEKEKKLIETIAFHNPAISQNTVLIKPEVLKIFAPKSTEVPRTENKPLITNKLNFAPRMRAKSKPESINQVRKEGRTRSKKKRKITTSSVPRTFTINPSRIDWNEINNKKKTIGDAGELVVYNYEIDKLIRSDLIELIPQIEHSSQIHGDGLGYDIKSFNEEGDMIYIEVKSTKGPLRTPLLFTKNEMDKMEQIGDKYYLYRVTDLNTETKSGSITIYPGCKSVTDTFEFTPEVLKARVK